MPHYVIENPCANPWLFRYNAAACQRYTRHMLRTGRHPKPRRIVNRSASAGLGGIADRLVEAGLPYYQREMRNIRPWLYNQGRELGREAIRVFKRQTGQLPPVRAKPSGPPWVNQLIKPVIDPLVAGMTREVKPVAKQTVKELAVAGGVGVGIVVLLSFVGGYLLGQGDTRLR